MLLCELITFWQQDYLLSAAATVDVAVDAVHPIAYSKSKKNTFTPILLCIYFSEGVQLIAVGARSQSVLVVLISQQAFHILSHIMQYDNISSIQLL